MQESKKSKAYTLFSEGKQSSSPEVKALKLKLNTRYNYFSEWQRTGKPDHIPLRESKGTTVAGRTTLQGGEEIGGYVEPETPVKAEIATTDDTPPKETPKIVEDEEGIEALGEAATPESEESLEEPPEGHKPKIELGLDGNDKQSVSADVVGFGLPIRVQLSLKTLTLYQYAASRAEDDLTLGDFLDLVTTDYFQGRGRDLGLIELKNG